VYRRLHAAYRDLREAVRGDFDVVDDPEGELLDSVLGLLYRRRAEVPAAEREDDDLPTNPVTFYVAEAERRLGEHDRRPRTFSDAAALLSRMGEWARAAAEYQSLLRADLSKAYAAYNLACTYASWSADPDARLSEAERRRKRVEALGALEASVEGGYADWPWMEQDRDLDSIRGDPRYAAMLAKAKARFKFEEAKPAPPRAPAAGMGEPPRRSEGR
jgi:hypothetical protein